MFNNNNRKNVSNFDFSLVFVVRIKLNFHYIKMTEKMYDNFLEKYKNSVLEILKICKALTNFDFNSTIREKMHRAVQLFGNKIIERFSLTTSQTEHPN